MKKVEKKMPKVSIIVPVFNLERCIEETAGYLTQQTEKDIQIIFVDDGSTDGTNKILKKIVADDSRCILLEQKNKGPGAARNLGMSRAVGRYLLFLDGDDIFDLKLVEKLYKRANEMGADIVICGVQNYDVETGIYTSNPSALRYDLLPKDKDVFSPLDVSANIFQIAGAVIWNKLYRRDLFVDSKMSFPAMYYAEDMSVSFLLYCYTKRVAVLTEELIIHRRNQGTSICDNSYLHWKDEAEALKLIKQKLECLCLYEIYFESFMKRVIFDLDRLFRSYVTDEAFTGLYLFSKEHFNYPLKEYALRYETNEYKRGFIDLFTTSSTPLDFCLKLHKLKPIMPNEIQRKYWKFPFEIIPRNSKIVLFGAGDVGKDLYIQLVQTNWCQIVAWVDSFPNRYKQKGLPVESVNIIKQIEYDYILIALRNEDLFKEISSSLMDIGVKKGKLMEYVPDTDREQIAVSLSQNK